MDLDYYVERVLLGIERLAPFYAQEWKFDQKSPDAGAALAIIFARNLAVSMERFNRMPFKHRLALYSLLKEDVLPAIPSEGFVCVEPLSHSREGRTLKKGFKLYCLDKDGDKIPFELTEDVLILPATLSKMILTDYNTDTVQFWNNANSSFSFARQRSKRFIEFEHEYFRSGLFSYLNMHDLNSLFGNLKIVKPYYFDLSGQRFDLECSVCDKGLDFSSLCNVECKVQGVGFEIIDVDALAELSLDNISVIAERFSLPPSAVFAKNETVTTNEFYPFGTEPTYFDDVVFFSETLGIKNAEIKLEFDVDFDVFDVGEILPVPLPRGKLIVLKKNIKKPKIYDIKLKNVEWEYFNGIGYAPLLVKSVSKSVFSGGSCGRVSVEFERPTDMEVVTVGAKIGYCVRARVNSIENVYKRPARVFVPRLSNVSFSCVAPPQKVQPQRAFFGDESFSYFDYSYQGMGKRPKTRGTTLYFGFDKPLFGKNIRLFVNASGGGGRAQWQYLTKEGWTTLNLTDETNNLLQAGRVSFDISEPTIESSIYGRTAHWIRVVFQKECDLCVEQLRTNAVQISQCDESYGGTYFVDKSGISLLNHNNIINEEIFIGTDFETRLVRGKDYYIDRAEGVVEFCKELRRTDGFTFKADLCFGGGEHTNMPKDSVFLPFVPLGNEGTITNPLPLSGGMERESVQNAAERIACSLRNSNRCVTIQDYIDLMDEPDIACVKGFNNNGAVTLVVLIKDYKNPYAFSSIQRRSMQRLNALRPIGTPKINIVPPSFLPINIKGEIKAWEGYMLNEALDVLDRLFDPIARMETLGLGLTLSVKDVKNALLSVPKIADVNLLVDLPTNESNPYLLPIRGCFDIKIVN